MPTEEERATQYRADQQAGERAALARWKGLAGDPTAYKNLLARLKPVRRDPGWDPVPLVTESERIANG